MVFNDPKYQKDINLLSECGKWVYNNTGKELQCLYFRGETLPISNNTFWNVVKFGYDCKIAQGTYIIQDIR